MNRKKTYFTRLKWLAVLSFMAVFSCTKEDKKEKSPEAQKSPETTVMASEKENPTAAETKKEINDFVPEGYYVFEKSFGDLNKDGVKDCILVIKKIDPQNIITDENRGKLDRNRRGIIVLFKTDKGYELASENNTCFSSENEEGGNYYAPELMVYEEKGNLNIHYAHGRYGYWKYIFRYQNSDFELIGYENSSNTGPVVNNTTSINFSTKKMLTQENTNEAAESGDEVFKKEWSNIKIDKLFTLSGIKDFDELEMWSMYRK